MNLNTIAEVKRPKSFEEIEWRDGHAWLGGGTWLFSEPQVATDTLVDLDESRLAGTDRDARGAGDRRDLQDRRAARLRRPAGMAGRAAVPTNASTAFLMSFKIWNAATVGGNVCMSLPAGAMISLTAALEGVCTCGRATASRARFRSSTSSPATTPTCCRRASCCGRSSCRPRRLSKRFAMRQVSLTHSRPLGGADHRHGRRQGRRTSC